MPRPLPTSPAARQSIADEAATAERVVAARLMNVRAMETVGRQARNPVFRGAAAQAHLAAEYARLAAILQEPPPSLVHCGPCLTLPDPSLSPAEYLKALHRELIRLQREAIASPGDLAETERSLVAELRKQGKPNQAALVELLIGRSSASIQEVADKVHGDQDASDRAIRVNCRRVNEVAEALGLAPRYGCRAGTVFKDP